ncbi:response regulator [Aeoliella mucimassa]|uniref:histidine kinase n=1 Tax=Aeoliella mucimassa TaxID=2527972 RepID=A0A518AVK8_9BACT|nr:response regulator [Aeoliella mucimassa]QDU58756.1 Sensory/regulatory protein RpfC [Aeoliella mucimassa]
MKALIEFAQSKFTDLSPSVQLKLADQFKSIHIRTDRMFAVLMLLQWVGGIAMALIVSPHTWIGAKSELHPHVAMAVFGGFVLASMPIALAIFHPGRTTTRMVIACSQVMFSSLLIHLSGGRIETHFHIFGSLAFLAAYRDVRVLAPATLIVAVDHLIRGVWWPESVFGIATASEWRWLEHAAWVVFEDIFLLIVILQSQREMVDLAQHTDRLEQGELQLKRAITAAEHANRTKSKFLANMSHEIRTPLNGILGFTEVLMRDRLSISDDESDEYLHTIRRSGQHLLALINDVLDISKIEADQLQVENIAYSPHQIISETISVLRVAATEKGIGLDYRWESTIPSTIETDPYRLKQLLLNLVGNAIKFTDQGSVVVVARIESAAENPELVVEVRDTGIGIAQEKLDAIFQPFVQADDTVTRKYGGTGLGLAISKRIAEALGGSLTAQSIVGQGSTFIVRVATGDLTSVGDYAPAVHLPGGDIRQQITPSCDLNGLSVLVVDDGDTNRKLIRLLLERNGAKVRQAENGQVAIDMAIQTSFDVILMDMQMPVLDGYSATSRLRDAGFQGPIIALTAHAMKGDREKCERAGCTGYLSKPIDADELYQAICIAITDGKCTAETPSSSAAVPQITGEPIRSLLPTSDAEIREIVSEFLDTFDSKSVAMQQAWESGDLEALAQLAHWLKGAAGTVGFGCFTNPAAELELNARDGEVANISAPLQEIKELKQRLVL